MRKAADRSYWTNEMAYSLHLSTEVAWHITAKLSSKKIKIFWERLPLKRSMGINRSNEQVSINGSNDFLGKWTGWRCTQIWSTKKCTGRERHWGSAKLSDTRQLNICGDWYLKLLFLVLAYIRGSSVQRSESVQSLCQVSAEDPLRRPETVSCGMFHQDNALLPNVTSQRWWPPGWPSGEWKWFNTHPTAYIQP